MTLLALFHVPWYSVTTNLLSEINGDINPTIPQFPANQLLPRRALLCTPMQSLIVGVCSH
jgi:hypothetical protein